MEEASPKKSVLKNVEGQVEFDPMIGLGRAYGKQEHKLAIILEIEEQSLCS